MYELFSDDKGFIFSIGLLHSFLVKIYTILYLSEIKIKTFSRDGDFQNTPLGFAASPHKWRDPETSRIWCSVARVSPQLGRNETTKINARYLPIYGGIPLSGRGVSKNTREGVFIYQEILVCCRWCWRSWSICFFIEISLIFNCLFKSILNILSKGRYIFIKIFFIPFIFSFFN